MGNTQIKFSDGQKIEHQRTNGPICMIAIESNNVVLAYSDDNDSGTIWVTHSVDGKEWLNTKSIANQSLSDAAAMTKLGDKLVLIYRSNSGKNIWVTKSTDGITWESTTRISEQSTKGPMCLTVHNNILWLVYADSDGSGRIWVTSSVDGVKWENTKSISRQQMSDAAALVSLNNELVLVYKDHSENAMWVTTSPDGTNWSSATRISGQTTSNVICLTVRKRENEKDVLWLMYNDSNANNQIWVTSSLDGHTWTNGKYLPGQQMYAAAGLANFGDSLLLVYKSNTDTCMYSTIGTIQ